MPHVFQKQYFWIPVLVRAICFCVCFAEQIQMEMRSALTRCLTTIIPSLYAMMILSQMLLESGVWRLLAKPFRWFGEKCLGIAEPYFAVFLLSQFAGYPVGAGMLCTLVKQHCITKKDGEKLLCVCYGGGPAFLLGLLGNVPCRSAIFWLIFSANILSNTVLCTLLFRFHPLKNDVSERKAITPVSAEMLVDCTSGAGKLLLKLCGVILCFSAWIGMADAAGLFRICREWTMKIELPFSGSDLLRCVLEISNCAALSMPMRWRVPVLAALLSFGGICVILQIRAVVGTSLSMKLFITVRLLCGLLSGGICAVGLYFLPIPITETVVSVSAVPQVSGNSIVPSVLLLCMMLFVFREESFLHNHKKIREIA